MQGFDMNNNTYTVIFKRRDNRSDEIYNYKSLEEAQYHFNLFKNDDSDLYNRIELCRENGAMQMIIDVLKFQGIKTKLGDKNERKGP